MNKTKISILTAAVFLAAVLPGAAPLQAPRFNPKAVSPRYYRSDSKVKITIAAKGKALCEVVVRDRKNRATVLAGQELSTYLSRIIGSPVPVVAKPTGKVPAFILGSAGAELVKCDLKKIDRDGFIIKTAGSNIVIAGIDNFDRRTGSMERGSLNGVYEFLERFGGVRFYFPGEIGTIVPRKADWVLPGIDIADRPDNQYRRTYCTGVRNLGNGKLTGYGDKTIAYIKNYSSYQIRSSTLVLPNCHGLAELFLVQRFAKTKPEFFALRDNGKRHDGSVITRGSDVKGQLCFTNDELKEVIYQDAKAFLTGQPASSRGIHHWVKSRHSLPFFNIMPNDSNYACRCSGCYKHYTAGPQASSNMIWKFKTDIARKLQQEKIPGYCTMMAYSNYRLIPEVDIPSNVIVMLALTGPWNELNPSQAKFYQLLKDWNRKLNAKTYLWTYTNKCSSLIPDVPNFTPRAVGNFFKKTAPWSFGSFLESETDFWIFNFMNFYVFGKVMWDVTTDLDALMAEHLKLMYGPAAPQMKEFYETLERHWLKDIMSNIRETTAGPKTVVPSQYEIWTKIYGPKEIARINKLFDDAEKAAAKDAMALKRLKFMRKEMWGRVLDGARRFEKHNSDNKLWTIYVKPVNDKITIDGKLDEAVWKKAAPVWMLPRTKEKVEVHTRVRMLADKDYFYVGIESDEPHTSKMLCGKRKFDENDMWRDNLVELFFAGKHSDNTMYQIMLTSDGMVCDLRSVNSIKDFNWNSGLVFKPGVIPGKMWVAEAKIPRRSLPEIKGNSFAVNFTRGRKLDPAVKVVEPYYTWNRFVRQRPENCGTAIIGEKPESSSIVGIGDFDAPVYKRFMRNGKITWYSNRKIIVDREIFRTAGAAIRLEGEENNTVRQYIPKTKLKSNTRYKLSFFIKLKGVSGGKEAPRGGVTSDVRFGNGGENSVFHPFKQALTGDVEWTRFEFEFTTPDKVGAKTKPYIGFYLHKKCSGAAWIDHVELVEVKK
ncbi:MAG: DUF4838 domain-containing protein [Lentisphaeria bacterium]|nr:DUF4838 domain-containing protein [Lentisphaeria bacterium]